MTTRLNERNIAVIAIALSTLVFAAGTCAVVKKQNRYDQGQECLEREASEAKR